MWKKMLMKEPFFKVFRNNIVKNIHYVYIICILVKVKFNACAKIIYSYLAKDYIFIFVESFSITFTWFPGKYSPRFYQSFQQLSVSQSFWWRELFNNAKAKISSIKLSPRHLANTFTYALFSPVFPSFPRFSSAFPSPSCLLQRKSATSAVKKSDSQTPCIPLFIQMCKIFIYIFHC